MSQPENPPVVQRAVGDRVPCARHPAVMTFIRCAICGVVICPSCAEFGPEGACCPNCARQWTKRGDGHASDGGASPGRVVLALVCGLAIAALGGVALAIVSARALLIVPLLLMGFAVGEAMASLVGQRASAVLGLLAIACTVVGPLVAAAAWRAISTQLAPRFGGPLGPSEVAGPVDLALLLIAGGVAAWRAGSSGPRPPLRR